MDFELNERQTMLKTMAKDFLSRECTKVKVRELEKNERGYDPDMWLKMVDLGWQGLVLPEMYGGSGADFLDLVILIEEMGRNITPSPFFSTIALCALPVLKFGNKRQKSKYLPSIAEGSSIWAFACVERSGRYEADDINCSASFDGEQYIINGEKMFVAYANSADYFLVVCCIDNTVVADRGLNLFIVDARSRGIKIEPLETLAGDAQCRITFKNVIVNRRDILAGVNEGWRVFEYIMLWATVLKCSEISGACRTVLEMTNSYAKERTQFDKTIGSFMVIQHKIADMLMDVEGLQYLVYYAAWLLSTGVKANMQVSIAKAKANQVYQRICIDGIKIHGAIGFSMDHDIGCYFRRIKAAEFVMGDTDMHLDRIAAGLKL
jgi:hypothetical protein